MDYKSPFQSSDDQCIFRNVWIHMAGYNNPTLYLETTDIFESMNTPYSGGTSSHTAAVGLQLCSLSFPCQVVISLLSSGSNYFADAQVSCFYSKHHEFASACSWQTPVTAIISFYKVNNKATMDEVLRL